VGKTTFFSGTPNSDTWAIEQTLDLPAGGFDMNNFYGKNLLCTVGKEGPPHSLDDFMTGKIRRAYVWDKYLTESQV